LEQQSEKFDPSSKSVYLENNSEQSERKLDHEENAGGSDQQVGIKRPRTKHRQRRLHGVTENLDSIHVDSENDGNIDSERSVCGVSGDVNTTADDSCQLSYTASHRLTDTEADDDGELTDEHAVQRDHVTTHTGRRLFTPDSAVTSMYFMFVCLSTQ